MVVSKINNLLVDSTQEPVLTCRDTAHRNCSTLRLDQPKIRIGSLSRINNPINDLPVGMASIYSDFIRFVWSVFSVLAELVGVACWMSSHGCGPERG